jgi:hypothetical protein
MYDFLKLVAAGVSKHRGFSSFSRAFLLADRKKGSRTLFGSRVGVEVKKPDTLTNPTGYASHGPIQHSQVIQFAQPQAVLAPTFSLKGATNPCQNRSNFHHTTLMISEVASEPDSRIQSTQVTHRIINIPPMSFQNLHPDLGWSRLPRAVINTFKRVHSLLT